MRKYGATVDNLLSVDLVTADGELVTASERREPRSVLGVRGGGGNFGIVTSFEYRLHPVGPIVLARADLPPASRMPGGTALLPRVRRRRARRAHDDRRARARAATAVPARGRARQADRHGGRLLRRAAEDGAEVVRPLEAVRQPDRRSARAQAVRWRCSRCSTRWCRTAGTATGSPSSCRRSPTMRSTRSSTTPRGSRRHARTPSSSSSAAALGARAGGRDRLQPARRRAQRRHQRRLDRGRPRGRPAHRLGARLLRRHAAARARPRLRQLPRRRGTATAFDRPTATESTTGWSSSSAHYDPTNFFRLNQNIEALTSRSIEARDFERSEFRSGRARCDFLDRTILSITAFAAAAAARRSRVRGRETSSRRHVPLARRTPAQTPRERRSDRCRRARCKQPADRVAVENPWSRDLHQPVARSARFGSTARVVAAWPTSPSAAPASTKRVEPQMKTLRLVRRRARRRRRSSSSSMRRAVAAPVRQVARASACGRPRSRWPAVPRAPRGRSRPRSVRDEKSSRIGVLLPIAGAVLATIDISGTTPEPPAMSSTGAGVVERPRRSSRRSGRASRSASPSRASSTRYGETSPSSSLSTVTASSSPGADPTE